MSIGDGLAHDVRGYTLSCAAIRKTDYAFVARGILPMYAELIEWLHTVQEFCGRVLADPADALQQKLLFEILERPMPRTGMTSAFGNHLSNEVNDQVSTLQSYLAESGDVVCDTFSEVVRGLMNRLAALREEVDFLAISHLVSNKSRIQ